MPRAATTRTEETGENTPRAPRRRVSTRAPRKTAARTAKKEEEVPVAVVRRKAPTRVVEKVVAEAVPKQKREKSLYVSGALFGLGILAAVLIGYSDQGQINPASVIAERNARLTAGVMDASETAEGEASSQLIPVQNTSTEKNGGLVRSTTQPQPTPQPVEESVATSTATTTEEVATTTSATEEVGVEAEAATPAEAVVETENELPVVEGVDEGEEVGGA